MEYKEDTWHTQSNPKEVNEKQKQQTMGIQRIYMNTQSKSNELQETHKVNVWKYKESHWSTKGYKKVQIHIWKSKAIHVITKTIQGVREMIFPNYQSKSRVL